MRHYDILLPITNGDGKEIEPEKIDGAYRDMLAVFGSFARQNQRAWGYQGSTCVGIVRLEIVTTNDKISRRLIQEFKERLQESLSQSELLITTYRVQSI